jgi:hypothetical protein
MLRAILIMSIILSSTIVILPLTNNNAFAGKEKPHLLTPYLNKILGAKWWQWALEIPTPINPLIDANPCNVNQHGYFFFLAGTTGGAAVERSCTIPKGKAIFFPVYTFFQTIEANNPNLDTIPEIKQAVINNVNQATNLKASVDGTNIKVDSKLRALTRIFEFTLPADNIYNEPNLGPYTTVADGYWVGLNPLKAGNHEISFSANGPGGFRTDVTYHIKVQ